MKHDVTHIATERLYMRELNMADADEIFRMFSNPDVARYWSSPAMTGVSEAGQFIRETQEGFQSGDLLEWGINKKETDQLIGTCAYSSWDKIHKRAEIGFALNRDYWGKGYMKEWLSVFIPFGFSALNLPRIEADVDPRNTASINLLKSFGFKREGYLRHRYHLNDKFRMQYCLDFLRVTFSLGTNKTSAGSDSILRESEFY